MNDKVTHINPEATRSNRLGGNIIVVGIGASAGGLDSLRELLGALKQHPKLCYIILQHLSPSHESVLSVLLGRATSLSVSQISGDITPAPNNIYIAPPAADVIIHDQRLKLIELQGSVVQGTGKAEPMFHQHGFA